METLLFILQIFSIVFLLLGLIWPQRSLFWYKGKRTRIKSTLIYFASSVVFSILFGLYEGAQISNFDKISTFDALDIDSDAPFIIKITEHGFFQTDNIYYKIKGEIVNNTGNTIVSADFSEKTGSVVRSNGLNFSLTTGPFIKINFSDAKFELNTNPNYSIGNYVYENGFDEDVKSKSVLKTISIDQPWENKVSKSFTFYIGNLDKIYSKYSPKTCLLFLPFVAEDPVGYSFSDRLKVFNLHGDWLSFQNSLIEKADSYSIKYDSTENSSNDLIIDSANKLLKYLFYSNGGLRGYFDDGTITGCPKCDLTQENLNSLYSSQVIGTYVIEGDALVSSEGEREYPDTIQDWAMIDFRWIKKIDN